ncbi:MAG: transposase [Opitutales bacterium]|jgi:REP element-mobilizing transposase RayT
MTPSDVPHLPTRKWLHHILPPWVGSSPNYFITLCCDERTTNQLCTDPNGHILLDAARHYHEGNKWYLHIILLMPDHLHAIVCLPPNEQLPRLIADFKKYTARAAGIEWQKGFFEHRLRNDESLDEKLNYIAMNPVRKGLVDSPDKWPWVFRS